MKDKPISIPDDVAARCDDPNQGETFEREFRRLAENTDKPKSPEPPKKRGRPKKNQ